MTKKITGLILLLFLSSPIFIQAEEAWNVTPDKTWSIDFSKNMNMEKASDHIRVEDASGASHPVTISSPHPDRIKVTPEDSYRTGETYTLIVDQALTDKNGQSLKDEAVRTFTVRPYGSQKETFTADKSLPAYVKDTTIEPVHDVPYWKWTEQDKSYLQQELPKQQLFTEMKTLQQELEEINSHYLEINGFHFYTSAVHSKLDALRRAMEARYNLLYFNQYNYPETSVTYNEEQASMAADDTNEGMFEADRELYNTLLDYPYDTSYTDNITVFSTPHTFEGINGFAKRSDSTIYLSAIQGEAPKTFYHELGHIFDYFFEPSRETYESIRDYSDFDETYENSFIESFAEDFKVVRYPYEDVVANLNKIGTPDEKTIEELESFFAETEKKAEPEVPSLLVNGTPYYSDIQVANEDQVTFSGDYLYGSIQVETPAGAQDSVEFNTPYSFTEEGVYTFRTPAGKIRFIYEEDGIWSQEETNTLQRVTMGQLTGGAYEWASAHEFDAGVFSYNRDHSFLMINGGYYQPFQITDSSLTGEEIRLNMDQGREDYYIYALPESMQTLPVILENNFLDIPDSSTDQAVIFNKEYGGETYSTGEIIDISGIAKTGSSPLSYQLLDSNGSSISGSSLFQEGSGLHYRKFQTSIHSGELAPGTYTFSLEQDFEPWKEFQFTIQ